MNWATPLRLVIRIPAYAVLLLYSAVNAHADAGFVGMQVQGIPPEAAAAIDLSGGVLVRDVGLGTPAAEAGILHGDILIEINGGRLTEFNQLMEVIKTSSSGDVVAFTLLRAGKPVDVEMILGDWPTHWKPGGDGFSNIPNAGLTLATLSEQIRKQLGIRWGAKGVAVTIVDVTKEGVTDLRRGDVILQVNQQIVWQPDQILEHYRAAKAAGKKDLLLFVEGNTGYRFLLLPVE